MSNGSATGLRVLSIINIIIACIMLAMGLNFLIGGASTAMASPDATSAMTLQVTPDQLNGYTDNVVNYTGYFSTANSIAVGIILLCAGGMYLPSGILGCLLSGNTDRTYGFYVVTGIGFAVSICALILYFWWAAGVWTWIFTIAAAVLEAICLGLASSAQGGDVSDYEEATESGY